MTKPEQILSRAMQRYGILSITLFLNKIPFMTRQEMTGLCQSVKQYGVINPIVVDPRGNVLIDGRCRLIAGEIVGVEVPIRRVEVIDPIAWVVSANVHRQSLTDEQRSEVAENIKAMQR